MKDLSPKCSDFERAGLRLEPELRLETHELTIARHAVMISLGRLDWWPREMRLRWLALHSKLGCILQQRENEA